jgi:flagellar hook assembly protein FlgD
LTIRIYDLNGDKVATIGNDKFDGSQKPNYYFRNWDCRNDAGNKLASGVYIYRVEAHDASTNDHAEATNKFAIIK